MIRRLVTNLREKSAHEAQNKRSTRPQLTTCRHARTCARAAASDVTATPSTLKIAQPGAARLTRDVTEPLFLIGGKRGQMILPICVNATRRPPWK